MEATKVQVVGDTFTAVIDEVEYSNITKTSRFYPAVEEWLKTNTPDPEFTFAEIASQKIALIESAIQSELDKEAVLAGYDSVHTAVTYADETAVATFSTDGQSFRKWRSLVWKYSYDVLADYQAGNIAEPTVESMIAGLPVRT